MTSYRKHSVADKTGLTCRSILYSIWDKKMHQACSNLGSINPLALEMDIK